MWSGSLGLSAESQRNTGNFADFSWYEYFDIPRIARSILRSQQRRTSQTRAARYSQERGSHTPSSAPQRSPRTGSRAVSLRTSSVMDAAARAAGIADAGSDPADQEPVRNIGRDEEAGVRRSSVNNSRASLPLSHKRSFSIATSRHRAGSTAGGVPSTAHGDTGGQEDGAEEEGDELEWGPSHPCFPHLNPHVPKDSPLYQSTRVIRIKRDWMIAGDLAPTFSTLYPEILDPFVSEDRFRELVKHVNEALISLYDPYSKHAILDAGIGFLTGWLWDDLGLTHAKRSLRALESWTQSYTADLADVRIIPLRRTAFLFLDIQIPDPQISSDDAPTEADSRSLADAKSARSMSLRRKYGGRIVRNPSRAGSAYSSSTRGGRATDDGDAGALPVPPIPLEYLQAVGAAEAKARAANGDGVGA